MGYTITEKILSQVSGRMVKAGEEVRAKPDFVLAYPLRGFSERYMNRLREDFGMDRLIEPERYGIFIDHNIPSTSPTMEALHVATRK